MMPIGRTQADCPTALASARHDPMEAALPEPMAYVPRGGRQVERPAVHLVPLDVHEEAEGRRQYGAAPVSPVIDLFRTVDVTQLPASPNPSVPGFGERCQGR